MTSASSPGVPRLCRIKRGRKMSRRRTFSKSGVYRARKVGFASIGPQTIQPAVPPGFRTRSASRAQPVLSSGNMRPLRLDNGIERAVGKGQGGHVAGRNAQIALSRAWQPAPRRPPASSDVMSQAVTVPVSSFPAIVMAGSPVPDAISRTSMSGEMPTSSIKRRLNVTSLLGFGPLAAAVQPGLRFFQ